MSLAPKSRRFIANDPPDVSKPDTGAMRDSYFEARSDREIWNLFREGHAGAFRHIYMQYFNVLYAYGSRIADDRELVKDTIQELFIALSQSRSLSETQSIKYYLFRALRWRIYRKLSRRQRYSQIHQEAAGFCPVYEEPREKSLILEQEEAIAKSKMNGALVQLTKRQREALYYFYEQGMSYRQVARIMKLSNVKSARNLVYNCIERLKKAIG